MGGELRRHQSCVLLLCPCLREVGLRLVERCEGARWSGRTEGFARFLTCAPHEPVSTFCQASSVIRRPIFPFCLIVVSASRRLWIDYNK